MRILLALFLFLAPVAFAQEVVVGKSDDEIGIDAFFDGSDVFIYGAIRPDAGILTSFEQPYDVILTVASPRAPVTVRRKERKFGIWVNVDSVDVDLAPHFYAIATSGPMEGILADVEDLRHSITVDRMIRSVGAPMDVRDAEEFPEAVQRIRENSGLFQTLEGGVTLRANTLFSASIEMPANLIEGDYDLRVFIIQNGEVRAIHESTIDVHKVGLERWLYDLAHQQPVYYGLLSLAIAIFAGWSASAVFRLIRP